MAKPSAIFKSKLCDKLYNSPKDEFFLQLNLGDRDDNPETKLSLA